MFRVLLRGIGFLLVAVAFAILVVDGSRSIAGGRVMFYALGDVAAWLGGLGGRTVPPAPWWSASAGWQEVARQFVTGLLVAPACLVAGGLGLLLLVAGRPAPARVGFSHRD